MVAVQINEYPFAHQTNHEPTRDRKLLLHRREINKLDIKLSQRGYTLVPLAIYVKNGKIKLELGLGRGKRQYEKRETVKEAEAQREIDRAMRNRHCTSARQPPVRTVSPTPAVAPFHAFGPSHLAAMGLIALAAAGLALLVRRVPAASRPVRFTAAALLLATTAAVIAIRAAHHILRLEDLLPLQLCDFLIFVSAFALVTRRRLAVELVYFWSLVGTLLAIVTPAVAHDFPHWHFITYFTLHGLVVVSATVLVLGERINPRRGAPWRALLAVNLYAVAVGALDAALGQNFLFLCRKPAEPTLLDRFGPWPIYILVGEVVALAGFWLLYLPFALSGVSGRPGREAPPPRVHSPGPPGGAGRFRSRSDC